MDHVFSTYASYLTMQFTSETRNTDIVSFGTIPDPTTFYKEYIPGTAGVLALISETFKESSRTFWYKYMRTNLIEKTHDLSRHFKFTHRKSGRIYVSPFFYMLGTKNGDDLKRAVFMYGNTFILSRLSFEVIDAVKFLSLTGLARTPLPDGTDPMMLPVVNFWRSPDDPHPISLTLRDLVGIVRKYHETLIQQKSVSVTDPRAADKVKYLDLTEPDKKTLKALFSENRYLREDLRSELASWLDAQPTSLDAWKVIVRELAGGVIVEERYLDPDTKTYKTFPRWYPDAITAQFVETVFNDAAKVEDLLTNPSLASNKEFASKVVDETLRAASEVRESDVPRYDAFPSVFRERVVSRFLEGLGFTPEMARRMSNQLAFHLGAQADYSSSLVTSKLSFVYMKMWATYGRSLRTGAAGSEDFSETGKLYSEVLSGFLRGHLNVEKQNSPVLKKLHEAISVSAAIHQAIVLRTVLSAFEYQREAESTIWKLETLKSRVDPDDATTLSIIDHMIQRVRMDLAIIEEFMAGLFDSRSARLGKGKETTPTEILKMIRNSKDLIKAFTLKNVMGGVAFGVTTIGYQSLIGIVQWITSELGRAFGASVIFTFPSLWDVLLEPPTLTDTLEYRRAFLGYAQGLEEFFTGGGNLFVKVPAFSEFFELLVPGKYGYTWWNNLLGLAVSAVVTVLSTLEKDDAPPSAANAINHESGMSFAEIAYILMAAFLGGAATSFQRYLRMPYYPGAMFGAVIGDILKKLLDGSLAIALNVGLPQELTDALSFFGRGVLDIIFQWQIPFLEMTIFEVALTLLLANVQEVIMEPLLAPITNLIVGAFQNLTVNYLTAELKRALMPEDVQRYTLSMWQSLGYQPRAIAGLQ